MKLKAKIGAFVATAAVACAIGAAPAQAAPSLPTSADLSALCAKSSNAKVKSLCSQGIAAYDNCSKQNSSKGLASCLASAAKGIIGSGVPTSGNANINDIVSKLKSLISGNTGNLSISGFDLSSILSKLGGAGGINLGSLLGKLGG